MVLAECLECCCNGDDHSDPGYGEFDCFEVADTEGDHHAIEIGAPRESLVPMTAVPRPSQRQHLAMSGLMVVVVAVAV